MITCLLIFINFPEHCLLLMIGDDLQYYALVNSQLHFEQGIQRLQLIQDHGWPADVY